MRNTSTLSILLSALVALSGVALFAGPASAQDEGGGEGEGEGVMVSGVMLLEGGATAGQGATVSIGIRRGIRDVEGVRYQHPVDVLSSPGFSEDLDFALSELDPIADMIRNGDAREAGERADHVIEVLEDYLQAVRRTQLIDAYMLSALARCRMRRRSQCEAGMARVLAFREGYEYDAERYPADYAELFERVRERTLAGRRANLRVETEPEGAEVYVDGRSYGPSPVEVPSLLVGDHYVTIKHLGYEMVIARAEVGAEGNSVARYELPENARAQLIVSPEAQRAIRGELGEEQAGQSIRSMGSTLGATQVIVGVVRPAGESQAHVQLFLYDMRTRFLLAQREADVPLGQDGLEASRQLAIELYRNVDLSGIVDAPDEDEPERPPELYEQWWFWTAIGVVVASGAAITAGVLLTEQDVPPGYLRLDGQFQ